MLGSGFVGIPVGALPQIAAGPGRTQTLVKVQILRRMGKSQAVSNAGITAILRNACKCCLVIFKRPNYILKFCKRIFNPLQCTILPEFPAARNPSRKREIQQFCRARGFFISGFTGFRFFAVRFRSPGDVQIPTAQTHAPFGAQSAPCLPNILRSAAERRPLMEEILSFPAFGESKGGFLRAFSALPAQI